MKSIYIDCSYLYHHRFLNTGIQRVVRKIVENFEQEAREHAYLSVPVTLQGNAFYPIRPEELYPETIKSLTPADLRKARIYHYFENTYVALQTLLNALFPFESVKRFIFAPKEQFGLNRFVYSFYSIPTGLFKWGKSVPNRDNPNQVVFCKGDILLLADSTWYLNIWPSVKDAKARGALIYAIIYDLIPISHPSFCDNILADVFKKWLFHSMEYADGYLTISNTVKTDLTAYLEYEFGKQSHAKLIDFFLLGGDFKRGIDTELPIRKNLIEMFSEQPTYLIVCTIEPRKNHIYLLDVFDRLWINGKKINLCIVGRIGWKVEATTSRIFNHDLLHRSLFYYQDLNDRELAYCYEKSKMLLFPSIVEGFGLPIVESLMHRLPVLANDTSIHREVGQDQIGYFDASDPSDLEKKIMDIESNGIPSNLVPDENYRWLGWNDSAKMLLEKMLIMARRQ